MSAGQPNWQKLMELGKLPKESRGKIPLLEQLDSATEQVDKFKEECCDVCWDKFFGGERALTPKALSVDQPEDPKALEPAKNLKPEGFVQVKCEVEDCAYVAEGKSEGVAQNNLRLHSKTHEPKA